MNKKENVYRWIDEHTDEIISLLRKLIQAPSVNAYFDEEDQYKNEQLAQEVLREFLDEIRTVWASGRPEKTL